MQRFCATLDLSDTLFKPGSMMSYCNPGYILLGALLEETTGAPYAELLHDRIVSPLGLRSAHLGRLDDDRCATGYTRNGKGKLLAVSPEPALGAASLPAGSMFWTSVVDLLRFGTFLVDGRSSECVRVLDRSTVCRMAQPRVACGDNTIGDSWGLGPAQFDWLGGSLVGHVGRAVGHTAYLIAHRPSGVVAALVTNDGSDAAVALYRSCLGAFFHRALGLRLPAWPQATASFPASVEDYVGEYRGAETIVRLEVIGDGALSASLEPVGAGSELATPTGDVPVLPGPGGSLLLGGEGTPFPRLAHLTGSNRPVDAEWLHLMAQVHRRC